MRLLMALGQGNINAGIGLIIPPQNEVVGGAYRLNPSVCPAVAHFVPAL